MHQHIVYGLAEGTNIHYVGYTAKLDTRRKVHLTRHPEWTLLTLGIYPSRKIGFKQERWWIKRLGAAGHPLTNVNDGGCGKPLGITPSNLTRARMSKSKIGNQNLLGYKHTPETKARISKNNTGKTHSIETKARMSKSHMGNNGTLGHKHTTEARARISRSLLGNKNALGNKNTLGHKLTPEHRAKLSKSGMGKKFSTEHRAKLSKAAKDAHEQRGRRHAR